MPERDPPPQPPPAALVIVEGAELGRRYDLEPRQMTIGRATHCDIPLSGADARISRVHAFVTLTEGGLEVRDSGSTGGTYVNGLLVHEGRLSHGDRLRVGGTVLVCLVGAELTGDYHDLVYRLATTDELTGVLNKRTFMEALGRELARARRDGEALAVAMVDVDHMSRCNARYGHPTGDVLLRQLARIIESWARERDVVARYGGDEFAVLAPGLEPAAAREHLEELRGKVEEAAWHGVGEAVALTICVGVVTYALDDTSAGDLVARALARSQDAKDRGRNQVVDRDAG